MSTWASQNDYVILCEGYSDRAFWGGILRHMLNCEPRPTEPLSATANDRSKGQHFFATPSGACIRVIPYNGKSKRWRALKQYVKESLTDSIGWILLNFDLDDADSVEGFDQQFCSTLASAAGSRESLRTERTSGDSLTVSLDSTRVVLLPWPRAPTTQKAFGMADLEAFAVAAISNAFPDRLKIATEAMRLRGGNAATTAKELFYTIYAAWHANEHSCSYMHELLLEGDYQHATQAQLEETGFLECVSELIEATIDPGPSRGSVGS